MVFQDYNQISTSFKGPSFCDFLKSLLGLPDISHDGKSYMHIYSRLGYSPALGYYQYPLAGFSENRYGNFTALRYLNCYHQYNKTDV